MTLELFAGLGVRDLAAAEPWYVAVLGAAPAFRPHDAEAVWTLGDGRHVYVVERPDHSGGGLATVIVDDLDERVAAARAAGVEPALEETYDNGVRKTTYCDPDGNEVAFGQAPG